MVAAEGIVTPDGGGGPCHSREVCTSAIVHLTERHLPCEMYGRAFPARDCSGLPDVLKEVKARPVVIRSVIGVKFALGVL